MGLIAVAGSKIYIGLRVADTTVVELADFDDAVWTEIKGWAQTGNVGDTQNLITQTLIGENREDVAKGTVSGGQMDNTFKPLPNDPGQIKFRAAQETCLPYQFKIEWGAGCAPEDTATITIATPGVVTVAGGHGLEAGAPVVFTTTGTLPTGLVAGTTYYVIASGLTATSFSVAATPGGSAIATTGTQSGVHTVTAQPKGQTDLFLGLALYGQKTGGEAEAGLQSK